MKKRNNTKETTRKVASQIARKRTTPYSQNGDIQSFLTPETFVNRRKRRLPMKRIYAKGKGLHYKVKRSFDLLLRQIGRQQKANTNERQMMQTILFDPALKDKIYQIIKSKKWINLIQNQTRNKNKMTAIKKFIEEMEKQFKIKYQQINVQCDTQEKEQKENQQPTCEDKPGDNACQKQFNSSNNICQIDS